MEIFTDFLEFFFDEICFFEFGIKPIEAIMWICFLIITILVIINISYLENFINFGITMIVGGIIAAIFIKIKNPF